jgi:ligand-binding sensor domain-containing protein
MKKLFAILSYTLCIIHCAFSQSAMGTWRTHISYTNTTQITQSKNKIYGISAGALFSIQKDEYTIETYSKTFGLNDNDIHFIKYSESDDILFIAYKNSNIDLLTDDGTIVNISDLYRKNMSGSKIINDVYFTEKATYIACDFGILVFDIDRKEFVETYIIGDNGDMTKVLNIDVKDNSIYALTTDNVLIASLSSNLLNYQNWEKLTDPDNSKENVDMIIEEGIVYLLKKDNVLYRYQNNNWEQYKTSVKNISNNNGIIFINDTNNKLSMITQNNTTDIAENAVDGLYDDEENTIWYIANGAIYSYNQNSEERNTFTPNGPLNNSSWRLKYSNGRIFSVPGGRWATNNYTPGTLSFYENGRWYGFSNDYLLLHTTTAGRCYDFVDIAINPNDKTHYWVASYGLGLYEFRNDAMYKFHHCDNSGLTTIFPTGDKYNYTRTDGMTYDNNGNLWILNNAGSLIKYIDPNGVYHDVPHAVSATTPQDIIISNKNPNQKILLIPRIKSSNTMSEIFAFDDNGTLDNISDDKTVTLTEVYDQDNKEINFCGSANLRSIAQDKNGALWVGTTEGLFLINDPNKMFNNNFRVYRIKIPRNDGTGLADYLLGTEEIKAIVVDGANRKWIGTASSGIYLVSEDGLETIHHFTSENSPLLSNAIQSIAINEQTGEVFIGTGNGLISYQSDAIEGGNKFKNVRAYPNPVRPEYNGIITITGLVADTQVRITDINGYLIYETQSNGGVATWNGCNASGEKVATGVYFAHCVSADGKQKHITKILIIK